jgi:DNA-binding NarL/FixJ family response regulator
MSLLRTQPVTLAVARFEDIVSRGLQSLIKDDPNLQLVAADVEHQHLGATLGAKAPHVAILNFGSLTSPAELRELHEAFPETSLLVLADSPTEVQSRQVLGFGATACLAKSTEARDVLHAIHLASRGHQVLSPAEEAQSFEPPGPTPLTAREADVLELLQGGQSNAEIAASLHVGVETVRTHARNIYRKLGVSSRRDLRPAG